MPTQDPSSESWTIARVLAWATSDFQSKGFDSPRLDAELLLCHVLGIGRVRLITESQKPLAADELAQFRELIQRRRTAEPIAYILGEREFFGLSFRVDARVLVPRPDSEILVETALRRTELRHLHGRALDLCTGSGCIAIAFALKRPTWTTVGSDISPEALEVARHNAHRLGAVWNLSFRQADLFGPASNDRYQLITANPPYIPAADIPTLQADVKNFEPRLALDGGHDGLVQLRKLIAESREHLAPGGVLAVEIGCDQGAQVRELMLSAGFDEIEVNQDYAGHNRVVSACTAV